MSNDGEIVFDIIVNNQDALTSVDQFTEHLTETIGVIRRMRDSFAAVETAVRSSASAMRDMAVTTQRTWRDVVSERRETKAASAAVGGTPQKGGPSNVDATARAGRAANNQGFQGLITGIRTETDQIRARLQIEATAAAKRMINSTERALHRTGTRWHGPLRRHGYLQRQP